MKRDQHVPRESLWRRGERFVRTFTADVDKDDVERLFQEDARRAFDVLVRDQSPKEDTDELTRFLHDTRRFFLGLSFKLSPARRLLFAACLLLPLVGLIQIEATLGPTEVSVDASPFLFLFSLGGLVLLLALEMVDRLRVRDELDIARELQRELLPDHVPPLSGYRVAHAYQTANEIGGDYYDVIELDDGRIVLTVGDASGHGIGAGLLMAIANATLKTAVDLDERPAAALDLLNRVLYRTGTKRAFMTLFYGVLEPESGRFDYACAGHPFPFLRRANGQVEELGSGSLPLGMRAQLDIPTGQTVIEPGDLLVLYTDGLPEAIGGPRGAEGSNIETFGFHRLQNLVAAVPPARTEDSPKRLHDQILQAVSVHRRGMPLADDLTLMVVARRQDQAKPAAA
ncbi:MAG: PP2C family protein-serine/threonine phosphatase [Acidobacteriota bacterium]